MSTPFTVMELGFANDPRIKQLTLTQRWIITAIMQDRMVDCAGYLNATPRDIAMLSEANYRTVVSALTKADELGLIKWFKEINLIHVTVKIEQHMKVLTHSAKDFYKKKVWTTLQKRLAQIEDFYTQTATYTTAKIQLFIAKLQRLFAQLLQKYNGLSDSDTVSPDVDLRSLDLYISPNTLPVNNARVSAEPQGGVEKIKEEKKEVVQVENKQQGFSKISFDFLKPPPEKKNIPGVLHPEAPRVEVEIKTPTLSELKTEEGKNFLQRTLAMVRRSKEIETQNTDFSEVLRKRREVLTEKENSLQRCQQIAENGRNAHYSGFITEVSWKGLKKAHDRFIKAELKDNKNEQAYMRRILNYFDTQDEAGKRNVIDLFYEGENYAESASFIIMKLKKQGANI